MKMKTPTWFNTDFGLLVLRIGVGIIFIFAGWMKVSDLHATVGMFASMGFGAFWAYVASFAELLGGIAVILGFYTRIAAGFLAITMAVAISVTFKNPEMMMTPMALLFSNLSLMLSGGGAKALKK